MSKYQEDDYLLLSGIQHFAFCRRQWALIHIEQQWFENLRTVEGNILHERSHDTQYSEKRKDLLFIRGLKVSSSTLRVTGECDVVEFHKDPEGITLYGREGTWRPFPVEYKRGKPKENNADILQLCGQAMCLEEMLACSIPKGALFYWEIRRREIIDFTPALREEVCSMIKEMHMLYSRGYTPKVKTGNFCRACSLAEICLPKLCKRFSAEKYINDYIKGDKP